MKLIRIGNRVIDPDHVTHASYEPVASAPGFTDTWQELVISFNTDEYEIFYNEEAEALWEYLQFVSSPLIRSEVTA